jgi:hypothetical protein
MTTSLKGNVVAGGKNMQNSSLKNSLAQAAKSLSDRPKELRGPFTIRTSNASSGSVLKSK